MPPQSRGGQGPRLSSRSTPNLSAAYSNDGQSPLHPDPLKHPSQPREQVHSHHANAQRLQEDGPADEFSPFADSQSSEDDEDSEGLASEDEDASNAQPGSAAKPSTKNGLLTPPPNRLYKRPAYATRSQTHLSPAPAAFAPPFYNRPPTPLPPSPSLSSLLRPAFASSTALAVPHAGAAPPASRPTTPDTSDTEARGASPHRPLASAGTAVGTPIPGAASSTASSLTASALTAPSAGVPRASPKVPTYEYYGFVLHLLASLALAAYVLWSYLPSPLLARLGVTYYPDRWWSLAVPAWLCVGVLYIYVALAGWNTEYLTLGMQRVECFVDDKGVVAAFDARTGGFRGARRRNRRGEGAEGEGEAWTGPLPDWKSVWSHGTDAVMDVPIGGVCEVLYGAAREDGDGDDNDDGWNG